MKPLIMVLTTSSVLLAAAISVLLVLTARELDSESYSGREIAWMSVPVVLILLGAYRLATGSHIARIGLGLVYALMAATFFFFAGYEVIVRARSVLSVALPLVWGTVLGGATFLLFFSSTLKAEMRLIRKSRASDLALTRKNQVPRP